jgi:chemotaxis protein methyltransferase CheR
MARRLALRELENPMSAPMTDSEFQLLRDFIQARFGLRFPTENAYLLERRLQPRLEALGLAGFHSYYDYLQDSALPERERELDELYDRIATRETYFFRESYQLAAFRNELLPALGHKHPRGNRLSVWSAGCASGEEVYSLAMEILDSGQLATWQIEIVGSDFSLQALATARRGVYGQSSFRQTDPLRLQRYFRTLTGRWEILDEVRRLCRFTRSNLMAADWGTVGGPFDAIFCRNVLIYFDRAARGPLVTRLADKLVPGGYLFLGHSESLLDVSTPLHLVHLGSEIVYQKPAL